jgi:predicted flap endonuclease-1-like 5' DNA nuclease/chromosome segregation ATPase
MSISYIVSALIACGFTCVVGAFGMRVYFVRNREIADREDPRDTQIRDLQATLQVTRKDAVERKTTTEDATKHLEFAHDRIKELLQSGKETTEKLESCKELLRAKITEREQLHDKFVTAEREVSTLKNRLEDVELELSMTNESGDMIDSGIDSGAAQATGEHRAVMTNTEKTALEERLAAAQTELASMGQKFSIAEQEAVTLRNQLRETPKNQSASGESQSMAADERKEFEEKLSAAQDRVFVAEGKLAAVQKESEEKLAAAQQRLVDVEKDSQERVAAAQESVSAAETRLAEAHQKASAAESNLMAAQERYSAAEDKLSAAQDRISATEGKLSTVQERILAAEGKLSAAEKEGEHRLASAQEKLIAVEKLAEQRIAAAKNQFLSVEKAAQDKLAAAEVRLSAAERVAEDRIAAAQENILAAETDANARLTAAEEEADTLKNRLQDTEQKLSDAEQADQTDTETVEDKTDVPPSGEMYASSVEDGSPSLIQCLNEELDRWKRHCHVLGDELKQQREQFEEELTDQDAGQQVIDEPTINTVFEESQFNEQASDEPAPEHPPEEPDTGYVADSGPVEEELEAPEPGSGPFAEPDAVVWSSPAASGGTHGAGDDDPDELTDIRGIGKVIAGKLHELGIYRYEQLASLDDDDFDRAHGLIPDFERRMRRDNWMEQARDLHSSKYSEQI